MLTFFSTKGLGLVTTLQVSWLPLSHPPRDVPLPFSLISPNSAAWGCPSYVLVNVPKAGYIYVVGLVGLPFWTQLLTFLLTSQNLLSQKHFCTLLGQTYSTLPLVTTSSFWPTLPRSYPLSHDCKWGLGKYFPVTHSSISYSCWVVLSVSTTWSAVDTDGFQGCTLALCSWSTNTSFLENVSAGIVSEQLKNIPEPVS